MSEVLNIDSCELVVVGTGLVESIVAGAFQRVDKLTLHLDKNDYYGDQWSSHTLSGIEKWIEGHDASQEVKSDVADVQVDDGKFIPLQYVSPFSNIEREWHVQDDLEPDSEGKTLFKWTKKALLDENRRFNLELSPKILFSSGDMVELLICSGVSRYLEFKNVSKILTYLDDEDRVVSVPCSRADVFSTDDVSVIEKRILMKLMESCQDEKALEAEVSEFTGKTFLEYLKYKKLTPRLTHYVMNAIAQTNETSTYQEGVERVQKFLKSLGRFGNSPYLWTQYGTGEIPQAFCRLCAVFGGIYYLNRDTEGLVVGSDGTCNAIISSGKRIDCKYCVLANGYLPSGGKYSRTHGVSRAIFVTDRSLSKENEEKIVIMTIGGSDFKVFETGFETASAPKDLRIVHFVGPQKQTAKVDIEALAQKFLSFAEEEEGKPRALWSLYFNVSQIEFEGDYPSNVFHIAGPSEAIDIDDVVAQAKAVYSAAYPDVEFLPKAPEPEDIIIDDGEATEQKHSTEEPEEKEADGVPAS